MLNRDLELIDGLGNYCSLDIYQNTLFLTLLRKPDNFLVFILITL